MNGSITKRKSKGGTSWGFVFDAGRDQNGKRLQRTRSGFATKREAADALRDAIAAFKAEQSTPAPVEIPTFAVFLERWMQEHAGRKCTPKTVERYGELGAYAVRQTVETAGATVRFGDFTLDKFGPMHVELAINALLDRGGRKTKECPAGSPLSAKTVRHIAVLMHGVFQKAVVWRLIDRNPMDGVELPKGKKNAPRVVEKDAAKKLLARARSTRLYPLILLDLATGARRGELLALQWSDIDFESGIMNVTKSLEQTKAGLRVKSTKSGKPRRFAVPSAALDALEEHRSRQQADLEMFGAEYKDNDLVFCQPEGGYYSPDRVGARVVELMRKAGLAAGVSLHSLRHTHASELLSKGVPIATVAKRLGHASPNITLSIYAHSLEADELAAAKIWDDAMTEVIAENKRRPPERERMLANVSAAKHRKESNQWKQRKRNGGDDGARTRDLRRDRPAF